MYRAAHRSRLSCFTILLARAVDNRWVFHQVAAFTAAMHAAVPGSLVVWYDSVTVQGDLKWQCRLNELNSAFFDACGECTPQSCSKAGLD